ncbi:MAG TPA: pyrroline-5-carboxylate reductase [bacterium]|nr:pyrroline-5-carboxylate reductase [bacterium]
MSFNGAAGFIGVGKMGGILVEGIVESGLLPGGDVAVFDIDSARVRALNEKFGVRQAGTIGDVVSASDIVFLCVKPDQFAGIAEQLRDAWSARKPSFVSIMAGVKASRIRGLLELEAPVIRVMPNVACLVRQGVAGIAEDPAAPAEINAFVKTIFDLLGGSVIVAESKLDAVTAISGSGPAYVFMFIEALADAGVKLGLDRASAEKLAVRTVAGSAVMAEQTGLNTLELRARVSSPGGTTVAATSRLESGGFRGLVIEAAEAAYKRSVDLAG